MQNDKNADSEWVKLKLKDFVKYMRSTKVIFDFIKMLGYNSYTCILG